MSHPAFNFKVRKNAKLREIMEALAKGAAEASIDARGVMIGPFLATQTGEHGVHIVLSHPEKVAATMWVALGPLPGGDEVRELIKAETQRHLLKAMRKRFAQVTVFGDLAELCDAAVATWPCACTIAFKGDGEPFTGARLFQEH